MSNLCGGITGKQAAAKLLELKPNFRQIGRVLIRHYIKFDVIVDWVIDGLGKVGIDVAQTDLFEKSKTLQKPCINNSHNKPVPNPE